MGQQELADRRVESEAVDAVPGRINEHRARTVGDVARGDQVPAGLEELGYRHRAGSFAPLVDGEDGAHGHVEVHVRGAVERVEDEEVFAHRVLVGDGHELGVLLGGQAGQPAGVVRQPRDGQVGEAVELHDRLALDVDVLRAAQDLGQAGPRRLAGDDLAGQGEIVEEVGQGARGLGMEGLLLEDVALDGDDGDGFAWSAMAPPKGTTLRAGVQARNGLVFGDRARL